MKQIWTWFVSLFILFSILFIFIAPSYFLSGFIFSIFPSPSFKSSDISSKEKFPAIEIIEKEFDDVRENGITEYELQKSKNQFLSAVTFGLESSKGRMNRMANSYLLYKEIKDLDEILEQIEKITVEDIKKAAQNMFDKKYYSKTILGNI